MSLSGACTLANLQSQGCDPTTALGLTATEVQQICANAAVTFGTITNNDYQFDKSYMDGGGHWNTGQDGLPGSLSLKADAGRVGRVANTVAAGAPIAWPVYTALNNFTNPTFGGHRLLTTLSTTDTDANADSFISNFNLSDTTCELNTVMCCFIKNRYTSNFVGNANVCNTDLGQAPHSNRVWDGYGTFDSSTPAYCVGFSWSSTATDVTNRFKGNSLFDAAYSYSTLQNGYVENIPGAPMCGCLEQMPAVTKADCRQVTVSKEAYVVTLSSSNQLVISPDLTKTAITYSNCATDLATAALKTWKRNTAKMSKVSSKLVGAQCSSINAKVLNEQFWVPGDVSAFTTKPDPNKWTQVAGYGTYFYPVKDSMAVQDANFRALVGSQPPYALVMRACPSCLPSHRQIFYKRLTLIPSASSGYNFLNLFLNDFTTINATSNPNLIGQDFQLYSTYQDAVAGTNPWQYCYLNQNEGVGFPGSCGPITYADCQWNMYNDSMCDSDYNAWLHGIFVQTM